MGKHARNLHERGTLILNDREVGHAADPEYGTGRLVFSLKHLAKLENCTIHDRCWFSLFANNRNFAHNCCTNVSGHRDCHHQFKVNTALYC